MTTASATVSPQNRTIVRAGAKLRALRIAFRTLERVAPGVGARWATSVWCTLPNTGGRRRDERPRPGERSTLTLADGRVIAVESWGFGPPVYLMHGWGGWRGQLGAFVQPLVDAGRRVVAVDAPSHGDSGPGQLGRGKATGVEFTEALAAAVGKHGKPAAVIGHSLGGAATAVAVLDGLPAAKLVFVAPSTKLSSGLAMLQWTLGFGERTRTRMLARMERLAGRHLSDYDITGLSRRVELPPTLVVHDRNDKEIPYDDGAELAATWPEAELATTEGLGHQRILRDPAVIALVVDYVTA
ncbi:alpha/beta fold hydrolase [Jiangella mangrovi]|uniref:Pimeloyl-ACP methyl ester carboxylesterase n=1 Tax=Jiangella mangrovi TaxID=1524084 RepID=A0A7W9GV93_9ACTN|nr:alpha/beta hydrolase [Jiangella mangrovi]MBB5790597.1 pimeloyl-ACP methyl ester carboxylesterase [Jiangella mangrovi]